MLRRAQMTLCLAALVIGSAVGCGGDSLERAAVARVADRDNPDAMTVLAKGDTTEESIVLLYDAEVGDVWRGSVSQSIGLEGTDSRLEMGMRVEIVDVAEDGDITSEQTVTSVDLGDPVPGTDDPAVADDIEGLVGTTITVVTDAFGYPLRTDIDFPDGIDPTLRRMIDDMEQALAEMSNPVPKDELGIGAMWTSTGEIDLGGITTLTTATYELVDIDGDDYTLDVTIEQTQSGGGTDQGLEFGVTGDGHGTGTVEGTRQAPMPLRAETSVEAEARFDVTGTGETMTTTAWTLVEGEVVD